MGRAKNWMMEQEENVYNGRKKEWIINQMNFDGKVFDEDSDEWHILSEEFDELRHQNGQYDEHMHAFDDDYANNLSELPEHAKYKIPENEFSTRYSDLIRKLNTTNEESNLTLFTAKDRIPFKVYKHNDSIVILPQSEKNNLSISREQLIEIAYKRKKSNLPSYTPPIIERIFNNSIFDEINIQNILYEDKKNMENLKNINENNIINEYINILCNEYGYKKENILQSKDVDIIIKSDNVELAYVEIKYVRDNYLDNILLTTTKRLFEKALRNSNSFLKLYVVFMLDGNWIVQEYNKNNHEFSQILDIPHYKELIYESGKESLKDWDLFIKTIKFDFLEQIQKGIDDEYSIEGNRVRDFLQSIFSDKLRKSIPKLKDYKNKLNQASTQVFWSQDNGFRLGFYKGESYESATQINITIWSSWGGGVFIKDNENLFFSNSDLIDLLKLEYQDFNFDYKQKHIFSLSFSNKNYYTEEKVIKAFSLLVDLFDYIGKSIDEVKNLIRKNKDNQNENFLLHKKNIPSFCTDVPNGKGIDCLDIERDVSAFSKLIAYKKLVPPLAIGLFGKWGSGKSFFMEKLEQKIDELKKENNIDNQLYFEKIAHIKFNAWHYSDTNLWASLVIEIFKKLNDFINSGKSDENKIESLYNELESTKKLLLEKENEKFLIEESINAYETKQRKLALEKEEKLFKLNDLKDVNNFIFKDEYIQSNWNELKEDFPSLKDKDINSVYEIYDDINNNYGLFKKFFGLLINYKHFRIYLGIVLLCIIALILGFKYLDEIKSMLSPFLVLVPTLAIYRKKFNNITSKINKFIKLYERKKQEREKEKSDNELNLLKEKVTLELELKIISEKISIDNNKLEEISLEIKHIKSGKYLADFIAERVESNDYKQHLGLISTIRNDFEKLVKYLKEPDTDALQRIDRIVLYIDDLDRCSEQKVMDVLEAIHLILAFDLFVVIVGVDTRWIKKALDETIIKDSTNIVKSSEYLEKIFQIPFHIQNMEDYSKERLLTNLMKSDIEVIKNDMPSKDKNDVMPSKDKNDVMPSKDKNDVMPSKDKKANENSINEDKLHKQLLIKQYEFDYIKDMAYLIGNTPRAITRFVNIYRIIRCHEYILDEILINFDIDYKLLIMILCIGSDIENFEIETYSIKLEELKFNQEDRDFFDTFDKDKKEKLIKFVSRFSFKDCE